MKKLFLLCIAAMALNGSYAQTKKPVAKKPVTKTTTKATSKLVEEPESRLDPATAGKYAKDFGKTMYNRINFEQEKDGYTLSINRWKPYTFEKEDGSKTTWYMIDVTIRWKSSQGGWPQTWKDVEYNGVIMCDEFGCEPNMLIKSKKEPSASGLAALVVKRSPVGEFDEQHKQGFSSMDPWLSGVNYVWNPEGCLND